MKYYITTILTYRNIQNCKVCDDITAMVLPFPNSTQGALECRDTPVGNHSATIFVIVQYTRVSLSGQTTA